MRHMTVAQALMVLTYILSERAAALDRLKAGKLARARCRELHRELKAATPAQQQPETSIREGVARQVAVGQVLRGLFDAWGQAPLGTPAMVEAAATLRAQILDAQRDEGTSAMDRAAFTLRLRTQMATLQPALAVLADTPVPEMVEAWLVAGEALADIVNNNTVGEVREGRSPGEIVVEIRRVLLALRHVVRGEQVLNPDLPENLEAQILGMGIAMSEQRRRRGAADTDPAEAIAPEETDVVETDSAVNVLSSAAPAPLNLAEVSES